MAGLLGSTSTSASSTNPMNAPTGTASMINGVEDWKNSTDQTVAGQVQKITAADSPLMQQARTTALQGMNQRGLVNSSLAGTAAQSAVLGAAMPIAQQDANTSASIAKYNADTRNNANQFNVQQQNAMTSQNLSGAQQSFSMSEEQKNNLAKMAAQQGYNLQNLSAQQFNELQRMATAQGYNLQNLSTQQANDLAKLAAQIQGQKDVVATQTEAAKDVAGIEAAYKSITQGSQSAATIVSNMQSSINAITANTTMDAAAKTAAIADIKANAEESLQLIGALAGDIDLSNYISQIGL